jgi:hypothetical protein
MKQRLSAGGAWTADPANSDWLQEPNVSCSHDTKSIACFSSTRGQIKTQLSICHLYQQHHGMVIWQYVGYAKRISAQQSKTPIAMDVRRMGRMISYS